MSLGGLRQEPTFKFTRFLTSLLQLYSAKLSLTFESKCFVFLHWLALERVENMWAVKYSSMHPPTFLLDYCQFEEFPPVKSFQLQTLFSLVFMDNRAPLNSRWHGIVAWFSPFCFNRISMRIVKLIFWDFASWQDSFYCTLCCSENFFSRFVWCLTGYIKNFEVIDPHRVGKINVELHGRIKDCKALTYRQDIRAKEIEQYRVRMLPTRQVFLYLLTFACPVCSLSVIVLTSYKKYHCRI